MGIKSVFLIRFQCAIGNNYSEDCNLFFILAKGKSFSNSRFKYLQRALQPKGDVCKNRFLLLGSRCVRILIWIGDGINGIKSYADAIRRNKLTQEKLLTMDELISRKKQDWCGTTLDSGTVSQEEDQRNASNFGKDDVSK